MIAERSAGVILYREENNKQLFLLLNYPTGHWDFIKGKIEINETLHQTAIRETEEETGIVDLDFIHSFEEKINYNFTFNKTLIHKEVVFFLAKTNTKNVTLSDEHLDYLWLEFDESVKKITYDNAKNVLIKAKNYLLKIC